MKKLFSLSLILLLYSITFAQFKQIAASNEFNEPRGSSALLLMKNGNLVLAEIGPRDSIRIRIYNKAYQEIAATSYAMLNAKRTSLSLNKALEINGEVVLFVNATEEKTWILYRVIIDPNSGQVKNEKYLLELKPEARNESSAVWRGNFSISKAADGDDYAIAYCNNYQSEKVKTIKVILFNKENVEVVRSYYETAEKEFESLTFRGLVVVNAETAALLFMGYPWKDGDPKMFLALTKKGLSALTIIEQKIPEDKVPGDPRLFYNSYSKKLVLAAVCVCGEKKENKYLCLIDPGTGKTEKMINYAFKDAFYEKANDIYGRKYFFYGKPINFLVDKNGDFSVIYQEEGYISTNSGASTYTYHSDIIVADFDKNGRLLNNYLEPRKIVLNPNSNFGDNYESYAYIKNNDKAFLFFNDKRENIERLENGKDPKQVIVVKDCDAFYFPLTGSNVMPPRKYLYKKTDEREEHIQFSFGNAFAYDKENDLFITLRLNRNEKERTKTVNIVWLKPE